MGIWFQHGVLGADEKGARFGLLSYCIIGPTGEKRYGIFGSEVRLWRLLGDEIKAYIWMSSQLC